MPDNPFITSLQQRFYSITPQHPCKTKKSQKQQIAIKKNPACRILRLRRVALATLFHSAAVRSLAERFLCHRTKFPMTQKSRHISSCRPFSFSLYPVKIPEDFPPDGPRMPRSTRSHTDRPLPGLPICLLIPSLPRKLLQRMVYTVNKIPTSWLLPEVS